LRGWRGTAIWPNEAIRSLQRNTPGAGNGDELVRRNVQPPWGSRYVVAPLARDGGRASIRAPDARGSGALFDADRLSACNPSTPHEHGDARTARVQICRTGSCVGRRERSPAPSFVAGQSRRDSDPRRIPADRPPLSRMAGARAGRRRLGLRRGRRSAAAKWALVDVLEGADRALLRPGSWFTAFRPDVRNVR
jgi:hypothetical protein